MQVSVLKFLSLKTVIRLLVSAVDLVQHSIQFIIKSVKCNS